MDAEKSQFGEPHGALLYVLAYLPLFELLAMSQVSKSLRNALNNDVLPWLKSIIVEKPLNSRLSDDALMKITSKANGRITTLALIDCVNITNVGLVGVIARNPLINKLHIPNCTGLTPHGVVEAVKMLNQHNGVLRSLRIKGIRNINEQHLVALKSLLQVKEAENQMERPEHSIDVEICPSCKKGGMALDCPRSWCVECGNCVRYGEVCYIVSPLDFYM